MEISNAQSKNVGHQKSYICLLMDSLIRSIKLNDALTTMENNKLKHLNNSTLVQFGCDMLWVMREFQNGVEAQDTFDRSICKYLLIGWGYSPDLVEESDRFFWKSVDEGKLGNFVDAVQRIVDVIAENEQMKLQLIRNLSLLANIQLGNYTVKQRHLIMDLRDSLDLKKSEADPAILRGGEEARALLFACENYVVAGRKPQT